ncbi:hypothetical protein [Blastococcus sp. URHD0036]|uniref:hypothetical protein n=1 Tax=Blastococcus sp. URHD0036 TaxID=1380356 RepID=UPI00049841D6|nr:hypothetical protein [Blastococcus sp. URHD0036]
MTWADDPRQQGRPDPAWGGPVAQAPVPAPPPAPPATLVVAAVLALVGVVATVVAAVTGGPGDVLGGSDWLAADTDAVAALLAVPLVAALIGGAVAALAGRGGGLLLTAGVALAVVAGAVAVATAVVDGIGEEAVRFGLAVATALVGIAIAVLAVVAPSAAWYRAAERRAAEQVVAGVLARPVADRAEITGRGPGWAVAAALLALATVGAAALVVGGIADDDDAPGSGFFESDSGSGYAYGPDPGSPFGNDSESPFGEDVDVDTGVTGAPVPVDESDAEYDPYFDRLARACRVGDLDACDELYYSTPVGSEYEDYGTTCGGRTTDEYYGTCAAEFD